MRTRKGSLIVVLIISGLIYLTLILMAFGQEPSKQQPFRFQAPPPALDIRPSYEAPKPCQ